MRKRIWTTIAIIILSFIITVGLYLLGDKLNGKYVISDLKDIVASVSTADFTVGSTDEPGANTTEMYYFIPDGDTFCAGHGWALTRRAEYVENSVAMADIAANGRKQKVTYYFHHKVKMAQSIAYARWLNAGAKEVQDIVWASWQWSSYTGNQSCLLENKIGDGLSANTADIYGRSYQFANFAYRALRNGNLGITCSPIVDNDSSLKALINQSDSSYIIGPYNISLSTMNESVLYGNGENIGSLVYKEIIGANPGENSKNQFCKGNISVNIKFQNATEITLTNESTSIEILDEGGNPINGNFPNFGRTFYIKYKSSIDAPIVDFIKPSISIQYLKPFDAEAYTFKSKTIEYSMLQDNSSIFREAIKTSTNGLEIKKAYSESDKTWIVAKTNEEYSFPEDRGGTTERLWGETVASITEEIRKLIQAKGYEWELGKLSIKIDYKMGLWYKNVFYELSSAQDAPWIHVTDKSTQEKYVIRDKRTGNTIASFDNMQEALSFIGDGTRYEIIIVPGTIEYEAKFENAIGDMGSYTGKGNSPEAARTDLKNKIEKVYISIKISSMISSEEIGKIQPYVKLEEVKAKWIIEVDPAGGGTPGTFAGKEINMYLGGNVWQSIPSNKVAEFEDNQYKGSKNLSGIEVQLWDSTKNYLVGVTRTDAQGEYGFQKINPLHKYKVIFRYDGMRFEDTKYTNNLSGGYSTAQESENDRIYFNDLYDEIESSPQNYFKDGQWRKAYGLYSKIENNSQDQNYIQYNNEEGSNLGAFRYYDALKIFESISTNTHNFDMTNSGTMNNSYYRLTNLNNEGYDVLKETFKIRLEQIGISDSEINNIWTFIMDTMITASTIAYPEENQFILENVDNLRNETIINLVNPQNQAQILQYRSLYRTEKDQSRQVDFGIYLRTYADLWLSKDLYKTTLLVNGKQQEYIYDKKKSTTDASGNWEINAGTYYFVGPTFADRANNVEYNSGETYTREIRKSEYLYDGSDVTGNIYDDIKNLQIFVTYKIAIKNQGQGIWTSVNEIVDYYDIDQYDYFGVAENSIVRENTFLGDAKGNKKYDVQIRQNSIYESKYGSTQGYYNNSSNINGLDNYSSLYITGIRDTSEENMGNARLKPGDFTYIYITFKVRTDENTGKVKIDQDVDGLLKGYEIDTLGKRNIAEINGYSTFYNNETKAGLIDLDSNPGSLKPKDIDTEGNIIASSNSWQNRLEDDTDKASNLKIKINTEDIIPNDTRRISGYVFEDARTEIATDKNTNKSNGAVIGNGVYNPNDVDAQGNKDKKINGVTIQLVELIQEVDSEGLPTGNYTKEHVWTSVSYQKNGSNWIDTNASLKDPRYYSGYGQSKVIISGPGVFEVKSTEFNENEKQGYYSFESLPPGVFFVKFIYGDTTQTVLTNGSDEVQEAFNKLTNEQKQAFVKDADNEGILGTSGLNSISYTGQDYKSTIYQKGVNQDPNVNNYNGIIGYISTETQNYNRKNPNDKNAMYNYDIDGSNIPNISDAKDVYSYREDEIKYSMGSSVNSSVEGLQTLKNHRAEVLSSGTQLTTKAKDDIISKINVLIDKYAENTNRNDYLQASKDQLEAIKELIDKTKMVAQTGVINMEVEYNRNLTKVYNKDDNDNVSYVQNLEYHIQDLDLGLTERPEAQLQLSKELTNIQIRLANNQILFDTNQSVNNLVYGNHNKYTEEDYYYRVEKNGALAYRLRQYIAVKQKERQEELVYASMDEELMSGATVRLTYKISIDNIGEVDYLDKDFYYLGQTINSGLENVSRTNARRVIDYVSNESNFEANYQNDVNDWGLITTSIILGGDTYDEDNDLVNKLYEDNLNTYNVLVTTNKLSGDLIPRAIDSTSDLRYSKKEIYLVLSTLLANTVKDRNLVYTNLVEILETTNTNGRRMQLSKVGNQPMPYQSEELSIDESSVWVHPQELDSDSGQKVQVTVPTGENRNYNRIIVITISSLAILGISIYAIKKKVLKK